MTNYTPAQLSKLAFIDARLEAGCRHCIRLRRARGKSDDVPLYLGASPDLGRDCQIEAYKADLAGLYPKAKRDSRLWGRVLWLIWLLAPHGEGDANP